MRHHWPQISGGTLTDPSRGTRASATGGTTSTAKIGIVSRTDTSAVVEMQTIMVVAKTSIVNTVGMTDIATIMDITIAALGMSIITMLITRVRLHRGSSCNPSTVKLRFQHNRLPDCQPSDGHVARVGQSLRAWPPKKCTQVSGRVTI